MQFSFAEELVQYSERGTKQWESKHKVVETTSAGGGHLELRLIDHGEGNLNFGIFGERALKRIAGKQAVAVLRFNFCHAVEDFAELRVDAKAGIDCVAVSAGRELAGGKPRAGAIPLRQA